jgi:hypothetical protein
MIYKEEICVEGVENETKFKLASQIRRRLKLKIQISKSRTQKCAQTNFCLQNVDFVLHVFLPKTANLTGKLKIFGNQTSEILCS